MADGAEGDVSDEDEAADVEDEHVREEMSRKSKKKHQRLAKELSDCVTICQSVSFKDFAHSKKYCKSFYPNNLFDQRCVDIFNKVECGVHERLHIYVGSFTSPGIDTR